MPVSRITACPSANGTKTCLPRQLPPLSHFVTDHRRRDEASGDQAGLEGLFRDFCHRVRLRPEGAFSLGNEHWRGGLLGDLASRAAGGAAGSAGEFLGDPLLL